jgi:hypothetical protein
MDNDERKPGLCACGHMLDQHDAAGARACSEPECRCATFLGDHYTNHQTNRITIELTLDMRTFARLARLGQYFASLNEQGNAALCCNAALDNLLQAVNAGMDRPGAWERDWLSKVFPDESWSSTALPQNYALFGARGASRDEPSENMQFLGMVPNDGKVRDIVIGRKNDDCPRCPAMGVCRRCGRHWTEAEG